MSDTYHSAALPGIRAGRGERRERRGLAIRANLPEFDRTELRLPRDRWSEGVRIPAESN